MKRPSLQLAAIISVAVGLLGACSDLSADCANSIVTPGGSCNNDSLQCPYSLVQPNCDGTSTTYATSCVCQQRAWSCPSPAACQPPPDDAGDDGAIDDGSTDAAANDGPIDDGNTGSDAAADVASDAACITPDISCNGVCVNPLLDKTNCGYCGHKCIGNQSCSGGSCI